MGPSGCKASNRHRNGLRMNPGFLQADEARDREVKAVEAGRYAKEIELAKHEAEEEKHRRHEAYLRYYVAGAYVGSPLRSV